MEVSRMLGNNACADARVLQLREHYMLKLNVAIVLRCTSSEAIE